MPGEPTTIPRDTSSASSRRVIAVALLIAWLPAACLAVSTKYRLLNPLGFEAACDQLKLTIDPHRDPATYFSYFDRLCLMRVDVTIAWAVAPALLVFISRRLRPGLAVAFVITCSTAVTLLLFVQNRCLSTVGSFVTLGMLHDALDWAITEPGVAGPYLLATPNLKLLAAVALIVSTAFAAARWAPRVAPAWMRKRRSWLSLLPGFVVALIAWIPIVPSSAANRSAIVSAATVLFETGENDPGAFAGLPQEALARQFRETTKSFVDENDGRYRGAASGFDVIIFILETAPYRCLPIGELPLDDFKTITRLSRNSFVAPCHYTTYPKTSCALFSLLSGLYPMSRDAFRLTGSTVGAWAGCGPSAQRLRDEPLHSGRSRRRRPQHVCRLGHRLNGHRRPC